MTDEDVFAPLYGRMVRTMQAWKSGSFSAGEKAVIVLVYVLSKSGYWEQLMDPPSWFDGKLRVACMSFIFGVTLAKDDLMEHGREIGMGISLRNLAARRLAM